LEGLKRLKITKKDAATKALNALAAQVFESGFLHGGMLVQHYYYYHYYYYYYYYYYFYFFFFFAILTIIAIDPHPGNVFVRPHPTHPSRGCQLVLLGPSVRDFGNLFVFMA